MEPLEPVEQVELTQPAELTQPTEPLTPSQPTERLLSFDIGKYNLAFADINYSERKISKINFDLRNISSKSATPVARCTALKELVEELSLTKDTVVVIERQTPNNTVAMEIMYGLIALVLQYTAQVVVFDPKLKFTTFRVEYNTRNAAHKKKSIALMTEFLKGYPDLLEIFSKCPKKDDISDALFQGLAQLKLMEKINLEDFTQKQ
jgi:hypothetical protein